MKQDKQNKLIMGASIGNCVHVAGAIHFLNIAADEGYRTEFLGPAVSIDSLIERIRQDKPYMVSLGYRLTPENIVPLVQDLQRQAQTLPEQPRWVFGGTRPVAEEVRKLGFFEKVFDSTEDLDDTIAFLRNTERGQGAVVYEDNLVARMDMKRPYPLLRHHFGLPSFQDTVDGIRTIAESGVLDVISLGPDQNTQQYFFRPDERDPRMDGAGGVPVRSVEDFETLKQATQCGNFPLIRSYSGTADVFRMAEVLKNTINNAWCAVPLCWYNELDGRGTRTIEVSIDEAQQLMKWHGERAIPVEANEPHHWALRDAHDALTAAMSYIAAYNAKQFGVKDYISQYMFNVPNSLSFSMDLAKALAQIELCESLADETFHVHRQTRAGLPFLSSDLDIAKGQLAASTYLQMSVNPDIIHVVGYSEAEHAATPDVVIESCRIVRGVIRSVLQGGVSYQQDQTVLARKEEIKRDAQMIIAFIKKRYAQQSKDPLADAYVIADCIRTGILDAPHIVKGESFRGTLATRVIDGKCVAYDVANDCILAEEERLRQFDSVACELRRLG